MLNPKDPKLEEEAKKRLEDSPLKVSADGKIEITLVDALEYSDAVT